jgi:hypothetical protein
MDLKVDTNISEENTASIFRGGGYGITTQNTNIDITIAKPCKFLRNSSFRNYIQVGKQDFGLGS